MKNYILCCLFPFFCYPASGGVCYNEVTSLNTPAKFTTSWEGHAPQKKKNSKKSKSSSDETQLNEQLTPEYRYKQYVKTLEEQKKYLRGEQPIPEKFQRRLSDLKNFTQNSDEEAYQKTEKQLIKRKTKYLRKVQQAADSLGFPTAKKTALINIYEQAYDQELKALQAGGSENFVEKYGRRTRWDDMQTDLQIRLAVQQLLPEEEYKRFVIAILPVIQYPVFLKGDVRTWISNHVRYPEEAVRNKMEGKAYITFYIEKDGTISNVKILRSSGYQILDTEAAETIKKMPKWQPGTIDGVPNRIKYTLPVYFSSPI